MFYKYIFFNWIALISSIYLPVFPYASSLIYANILRFSRKWCMLFRFTVIIFVLKTADELMIRVAHEIICMRYGLWTAFFEEYFSMCINTGLNTINLMYIFQLYKSIFHKEKWMIITYDSLTFKRNRIPYELRVKIAGTAF